MRELDDDEVLAVRTRGYVVARSVLDADELADIHVELESYFPGWLAHARAPDAVPLTPAGRQVQGFVEFPFVGRRLNEMGTSIVLMRNAERILGHSSLFIEQSHLLGKFAGGPADVEQALHCDYPDHTLLYPTARSSYGHVAAILYYTDVSEEDAPTAVVPSEATEGRVLWPARYTPEEWPSLYEAEEKVIVPAGSMLVYTMRTFHRGTAFRRQSARIVHFVDFCVAHRPWMGIVGWPRFAESKEWTRFVNGASPERLAAFGVPLPGDPYWDDEAIDGVGRRYPGLDLEPYRRAGSPT